MQASGAAVRSADANDGTEILGAAVFIRNGTANGGKQYVCAAEAPITIGSTALPFREISDQSALNASIAEKADQTEVDEINKKPLPSAIFSEQYAAILATDDNDQVHVAIRQDGSIHPLEAPGYKRFITYVTGTSPNRKVMVERDDGLVFEVAGGFEGDAYNPAMAGSKCRYYVNRGGRVYLEYQEMEPTAGLDPDVTTIAHIVTYGQSLAVGAYSGALLNPTPTFAARSLMFKSGIRTLDLDHSPVYRDRRQDVALLDHLTDAFEKTAGNYGETGWARLAAAVLAGTNALSAAHAALVTAHGIGASSYASLKKGTVPYTNLLVGVRRAYNAARLLGMAYRLPAVIFVQGEGNAAATTAAEYQDNLEELQADLDADIKAITGQTEDVKLIIDQLSSWTRSGVATSGVPIGQLEAAKANPTKIFLVGPKYALAYASDGMHMVANGYARHAEEVARAWRAIQAAAGYSPLRVSSAVRAGATITVATTGGTGNLVIDTTQVPAKANSGLELFQTGGTPVTISTVAVSGTNIIVTLSGDPGAATLQLGFGYTGTINANAGTANAPLTNIRDSSADASLYGGALQKWLCHDLVNVA
ncbi:endo-1,4-beta-xylanase Z precursor [Sinorhizobium americanum]|uniref:Endo-1,4-beta-xylanase Z n=1 Tax=Sinorhizobium americanum TaxID=194963 RepID=A0A1L3LMA0_9HYPH|nr:endo-1,4-beta-xylanase Z precursor [Sinorhizobium americanum]